MTRIDSHKGMAMRGAGWLVCALSCLVGWTSVAFAQPPDAKSPPKLNVADELPDFGAPAFGAFGEGETLSVEAFVKSNDGGPDGRLVVEAKIAPDWHLYSVTQPPGGPLRTKIEVLAEPALEVGGPFTPDKRPATRQVPEYPGVDLEEHSDKVVWTAPVRLPAGVSPDAYKVRVKLSGLTCRDNDSCLPVRTTVNVQLVGFKVERAEKPADTRPAPGSENAPATSSGDPKSAPPSGSAPPFSGKPGPFRAQLSHGTVEGHLEPSQVTPGGMVTLVVTGKPDTDWHFYVTADKDLGDDSPFKPTLIALDLPPGWTRGAVKANKPTQEKSVEGKPPAVYYEGEVTWTVELRAPADAPTGPMELRGYLAYQTCDEHSCDRPTGAAFLAKIAVGNPAGNRNRAPLEFQASSYKKAAQLAAGMPLAVVQTPATTDPPGARGTADVTPGAVSTRKWEDVELVTGDDKDITLGSVLLLAAVGGFLLNFMPCVLPVIGLKVMSFVHQAHGDRRRVFLLNLYYFLGLITVFMVLATLAALFQFGWGKQFQSTGFNIVLAAIVFVFALNMLGVWEIPLPGFVGTGTAAEVAEQEGPLGAFLKGALTTVLATPCTGPFMGTALTWAAKQPTPIIYTTFFALGLGMGIPYLAIGAFPQLLRFLPKPGGWMETFKQVMGFVLLGTVVFIFTFLQKDYLVATTGLLVGLGVACWWIGKTPVYAELGQKLSAWAIGSIVALVVGWISFMTLGPSTAVLPWKAFSRPDLEKMIADGNTVMVDFTADWCLTCKVNEVTALNTAKTFSLVKSQNVVVVKADKTRDDETSEAIDQLLLDLGHKSMSIPFLVIFPGDGGKPIAFSGPITQRMIADAIRRAGPSKNAGESSEQLARGGS